MEDVTKKISLYQKNEDYFTQYVSSLGLNKKELGLFFTPNWMVKFMVGLVCQGLMKKEKIEILEPACGFCQFLMELKRRVENKRTFHMTGVEINEKIIKNLENSEDTKNIKIIHSDFLLIDENKRYDIIIGNPPYGIPSPHPHYSYRLDREIINRYKTILTTWKGKYNMYGAFIEKSVRLLKENGQLIFIVPGTFMILDEFSKLRRFLANRGITEIIYFGREVFKPHADVSVVVLNFRKEREKNKLLLYEFNYKENKRILVKEDKRWNGNIVTFETEFSRRLKNTCSYTLGQIFEIKISPRTPEIKRSKYVVTNIDESSKNYLPILNGKNLKKGHIIYRNLTGYWIKKENKEKLRGFFRIPHIVVGLGFRGNGYLGAAYDRKAYPWMGDVYHLIPKTTLLNMEFNLPSNELVEYLNSELVKRYLNDVVKDITYHLNITILKLIPVPTKDEYEVLKLWKIT